MHPCQFFTHLCVQLSARAFNFNNTLFQWFFGFFGTPCTVYFNSLQGVPKKRKTF